MFSLLEDLTWFTYLLVLCSCCTSSPACGYVLRLMHDRIFECERVMCRQGSFLFGDFLGCSELRCTIGLFGSLHSGGHLIVVHELRPLLVITGMAWFC